MKRKYILEKLDSILEIGRYEKFPNVLDDDSFDTVSNPKTLINKPALNWYDEPGIIIDAEFFRKAVRSPKWDTKRIEKDIKNEYKNRDTSDLVLVLFRNEKGNSEIFILDQLVMM